MCKTILRIAFISCIIWLPATVSAFDLDGFKSVKFGITKSQLTKLGLDCNSKANTKSCSKIGLFEDIDETLFGKPIHRISAYLNDNGQVSDVAIISKTLTNADLINLYTESLGEPKLREMKNFLAETMHIFYWLSNKKNSIRVVVMSGKSETQGIVIYSDSESTSGMIEKSHEPRIYIKDSKDF